MSYMKAVCCRIKSDVKGCFSDAKEIPIIAMTANAFSDDIEHCKESGMNAHVAKPIDTALLIRIIAECVEERKTLYKNMDFS